MNPNRYDIWDVHQAAGQLQGQAISLSARHLNHGMARARFNREVSFYARRIVNEVELGDKTPEQGIEALLKEGRSLMLQSHALTRSKQRAISDAVKRTPRSKLTQPVMKPDPVRLLRFVHSLVCGLAVVGGGSFAVGAGGGAGGEGIGEVLYEAKK